jgi:hypothetical protein
MLLSLVAVAVAAHAMAVAVARAHLLNLEILLFRLPQQLPYW